MAPARVRKPKPKADVPKPEAVPALPVQASHPPLHSNPTQDPAAAPQIILHLPHAHDAASRCDGEDAAAEDASGGAQAAPPPLPFGDDALGLMVMTPGAPDGHDPDAPVPPRVMRGFESAWPRSTLHACWWCCHPFDGPPFGLPLRHAGGVFHCTGIFCSLECTLAYNRRERHGHEAADSANHVQLMALRMGRVATSVRPAPDRCLLALFGGPLGVDEFRAMGKGGAATAEGGGGRRLALHLPPIQAVVPAVEEISTATAGSARRTDQRIPLDLARIRRAERHTTSTGAAARAGRGARNTLEAAMPNLKVLPA